MNREINVCAHVKVQFACALERRHTSDGIVNPGCLEVKMFCSQSLNVYAHMNAFVHLINQ